MNVLFLLLLWCSAVRACFVLPTRKVNPYQLAPCDAVTRLSAARGERESMQLAFRSAENRSVALTIESEVQDLFRIEQVGYVQISGATDASRLWPWHCPETPCWVPDPILPLARPGQLAAIEGWTMSAWLTLVVPRNETRVGDHLATFTLDGVVHELVATIRSFELPARPTTLNMIELETGNLNRCGVDPVVYGSWLLQEYRLNPGNLFSSWSNGFIWNASTLTTWFQNGMNAMVVPMAPVANTTALVNALTPTDRARLLFYGFDEQGGNFSNVARAFLALKQAFPSIRTMTTAHVGTQYGVNDTSTFTAAALSALGIDNIVPNTYFMPPYANRSDAQRGGKQVWMYTSLMPYNPYPNLRLDNPLIDARLLLWQVKALHLDGFLYWGFNAWEDTSSLQKIPLVTESPLVDMNAWNVNTAAYVWLNGDGKILYCGEEGPVGSLRLANLRDGLDDADYVSMLDPSYAQDVLGMLISDKKLNQVERDPWLLHLLREEIGGMIN